MDDLRYLPELFNCPTEEVARRVILTPEQGLDTDERWERETAYLRERISWPDGLIVDYGCGIGRLCAGIGCPAIGVDISRTMRQMADAHVQDPTFGAVAPECFAALVDAGLRCSGGLAVWSLQHIADPIEAIDLLARAIASGGVLWVVNSGNRLIPVRREEDGAVGWLSDGLSIREILSERFEELTHQPMPADMCDKGAWIGSFLRKG